MLRWAPLVLSGADPRYVLPQPVSLALPGFFVDKKIGFSGHLRTFGLRPGTHWFTRELRRDTELHIQNIYTLIIFAEIFPSEYFLSCCQYESNLLGTLGRLRDFVSESKLQIQGGLGGCIARAPAG